MIDIDWSDPSARSHGYNDDAPLTMDEHGRLLPDPARFPSAAEGAGFGPLAETIHGLGLRLGIHVRSARHRHALHQHILWCNHDYHGLGRPLHRHRFG